MMTEQRVSDERLPLIRQAIADAKPNVLSTEEVDAMAADLQDERAESRRKDLWIKEMWEGRRLDSHQWLDHEETIKHLDKSLKDAEAEIADTKRTRCQRHPDIEPEDAWSHTYTNDSRTYFKTRVTYCPKCIEVISTDAYLWGES